MSKYLRINPIENNGFYFREYVFRIVLKTMCVFVEIVQCLNFPLILSLYFVVCGFITKSCSSKFLNDAINLVDSQANCFSVLLSS